MTKETLQKLAFFVGLGICPMLMGLLFMWGAGQVDTLTCTRVESTQIDCTLSNAFLGLIPSGQTVISGLVETELEQTCDDGSCSYSVLLITDDAQEVQFQTMGTSSIDRIDGDKLQIDYFLDTPTLRDFEHKSGPAWLGMILGAVFVLAGGLIVGSFVFYFWANW